MSDRNECAYCGGKGVGCHPVEPAPPAEALDQEFKAYEQMPVEILIGEYGRVATILALWQPRQDGYPETGESYEKLQAREKAVWRAIRAALARVREEYQGRITELEAKDAMWQDFLDRLRVAAMPCDGVSADSALKDIKAILWPVEVR